MKSRAIILLFSILSQNCHFASIEEVSRLKINIFEANERRYFKEMNIVLEKSGGIYPKHRIYYANRNKKLNAIDDFAIFNTMPKISISKNFINEPIEEGFVEIFKNLDCVKLYNMEGDTYIEFYFKGHRCFLFRGDIPPLGFLVNEELIRVNKNWSLIKLKS
jgi:hypothetical protein